MKSYKYLSAYVKGNKRPLNKLIYRLVILPPPERYRTVPTVPGPSSWAVGRGGGGTSDRSSAMVPIMIKKSATTRGIQETSISNAADMSRRPLGSRPDARFQAWATLFSLFHNLLRLHASPPKWDFFFALVARHQRQLPTRIWGLPGGG